CLDDRIIELGLDLTRQILRTKECIPGRNLERGQPPLFGCRHVADHVRAPWTRNRDGLDGPRLDLRDDSCEGDASEVDLASDHIVDCWAGTAVSDAGRLGAYDGLQERARGVHLTTSASMCLVHLVLVF